MKTINTGTTYVAGFLQGREAAVILLALLAVVGAILLILLIRRIVEENFIDREGWRVFNELCRAHALTRKERRLLLYYAQDLVPKNRAAMFVRPSLFEDAVLRAKQAKGVAGKFNLNPDAAGALNNGLREKLFGEYRLNGTLHGQTDKVYQEQAQ